MSYPRISRTLLTFLVLNFALPVGSQLVGAEPLQNFQPDRLVAWCIVPFDAKDRTPAERATMVQELGLTRVAYDWRAKHVSEFEEEIQQYKKHDIEFFAFWSWHDQLEPLISKYDIHPQIWITVPSPKATTQQEKVKAAAKQISPLATKVNKLGCKLGLYNHGGWGGHPKNMIAVCEQLRKEHGLNNVGIVYNFHHGHDHIADFATYLKELQPYLLCLNLNGMASPETVKGLKNKIIPIGDGEHEVEMIQTIIASQYHGPIGILDHRNELDAKESLQLNLDGLQKVLKSLEK